MSQFNRRDFLKALAVAAPASVLHVPNARAASKGKCRRRRRRLSAAPPLPST
jgi:hypothetical protein